MKYSLFGQLNNYTTFYKSYIIHNQLIKISQKSMPCVFKLIDCALSNAMNICWEILSPC